MSKENPHKAQRRSIRLKEYDYARTGAYFITVCAQDMKNLFGEISNGVMQSNGAGWMVAEYITHNPAQWEFDSLYQPDNSLPPK